MPRPIVALAVLALLSPLARAEDPPYPNPARDLHLDARLTSEATIVPGEPVRIGAVLVNRSQEEAVKVVLAGAGTESGVCEPRFRLTVRWLPGRGAEPVDLEAEPWTRCVVPAADWQRGPIRLLPDEEVDLTSCLKAVDTMFEFQRAGRYEIRLHYAVRRSTDGPAPFEVASNPVTVTVERPIEVTAKAIASLRVGEARTLAELLSVTVENQTTKDVDFTPGQIQFVIGETDPPDLLDLREDVSPKARVRAAPLKAGESRTFEGEKQYMLLRHLRLRAKKPGTLKIAAVYAPGHQDKSPDRDRTRIRSEWITLTAE